MQEDTGYMQYILEDSVKEKNSQILELNLVVKSLLNLLKETLSEEEFETAASIIKAKNLIR